MLPLIFDIQRFSIHDGPGIRTVIFFKGCNLECPWCQNPESISHKPELAFYPDKCIGSLDCVKACPFDAISYDKSVVIDRSICDNCNECNISCVSGAIKVIGREYNVDEVMEEILRDKDYYKISGGGVTFSGGEPTLHIDFIYELLLQCKAHNIHCNIETNGYFSWNKFQKILPLLDLIYFDIKIVDTYSHKNFLSAGNDKILSNIKRLTDSNAPVEFRIPLIPQYTASEQNLNDILSLLKKHGINKVHLLPYHNMGESKADKIESLLPKLGFQSFNPEEINSFINFFEKESIQTVSFR